MQQLRLRPPRTFSSVRFVLTDMDETLTFQGRLSAATYTALERLQAAGSIAHYFTADRGDSDAVAQCFTDHAVVKDEGHTYTGLTAIKQWKADSAKKYTYTSVPFAIEEKDGKIIVTSRLTGNFPGSPLDLRFFFVLEGSKIASLEIIL